MVLIANDNETKEVKELITETEIILSQQAVAYRRPFGLHLIVEFVTDPVTKENKIRPKLLSSYALDEQK